MNQSLGVKFFVPSSITVPWFPKLHFEDLSNQILQKSHILKHLRGPIFEIPDGILRDLFQRWIGGLVRLYLPFFFDNADQALEIAFRWALRPSPVFPQIS